jgi:predicted dehydrogenase
VRLLQVGAGYWGASWIDVVRGAPAWQLCGLVDVDPVALNRVADAARLPRNCRFGSLGEAIARTEPDVVLIAVPPQAHVATTREALESGCHCLVEKPLAPTVRESRILVQRAEELGRTLMVSQQYRFKPAPRTAQRLIREGAVGTVEAVDIRFFQSPQFTGSRLEQTEPLLSDMAVHHFDHIRSTISLEPIRVWARSQNTSWSPFAGNASAFALFETADGATVSYVASWTSRIPGPAWDGAWHVHGTEGGLYWDESSVRLYPTVRPTRPLRVPNRFRRRRTLGKGVKLDEIALTEREAVLAEFAACIREDREPETSGRDNLRSLALVEAALLSAQRRIEVNVNEVLGESSG